MKPAHSVLQCEKMYTNQKMYSSATSLNPPDGFNVQCDVMFSFFSICSSTPCDLWADFSVIFIKIKRQWLK